MSPIKLDAGGRVVVDSAGDIVAWANGLPFTAEGALAVAPEEQVQNFSNGVPLSAEGKVVTNG